MGFRKKMRDRDKKDAEARSYVDRLKREANQNRSRLGPPGSETRHNLNQIDRQHGGSGKKW